MNTSKQKQQKAQYGFGSKKRTKKLPVIKYAKPKLWKKINACKDYEELSSLKEERLKTSKPKNSDVNLDEPKAKQPSTSAKYPKLVTQMNVAVMMTLFNWTSFTIVSFCYETLYSLYEPNLFP